MSGSSGKSKELENRNSSETKTGRKNLTADNSGQNYLVPKKSEEKKLSSSVRIESENLSDYRDKKAKGERSDYTKNLETIRNKLKFLDITQQTSSEYSKNYVQALPSLSGYQCISPRTIGLHISAPSSTTNNFPNITRNSEKKIDAATTFSNSLSSCGGSPQGEKQVEHKQKSTDSSSRSAKIISICSPKEMYFTSSSFSNSSSNGGFKPHFRKVVNGSPKLLQQPPKKDTSSSDSTSESGQLSGLPKYRRRTRKSFRKRDISIAEVLNKVCDLKWENTSDKSKIVPSGEASSSTSTTDKDNVVQKKFKVSNKNLETRPITRRNQQDNAYKRISKSLPLKTIDSKLKEIQSQLPKTSQFMLSKNKSPRIASRSLTNAKKHTKAKPMSDCITNLKTRKSNTFSSNISLPQHQKTETNSHADINSMKKSGGPIQSKNTKSKILQKAEDLTLTAMICSPKEEISSTETKSGLHHPQSIPPKQKSQKNASYKFPFPSATIPKAFTLAGLSCDAMDRNNTPMQPKTYKTSTISSPTPRSDASDLRANSIHLDLPKAFELEKTKTSSYLTPYLKKKRNSKRITNGERFSRAKSLEFISSPRKLTCRQTAKSLPEKKQNHLKNISPKDVETMFVNLAYSDASVSNSETASYTIPSKRMCLRDDAEYDNFQIVIDNDDNSSIASSCTTPPKKMCVRDKTPEMMDEIKKDVKRNSSDTPSDKGSVESAPSEDFKNSILSMLLEWREKEIKINADQQRKDTSTITWTYQNSNSELQSPPESGPNEKYKTKPCTQDDPPDDTDLSLDSEEEEFGYLAAITEETRVVSEDDVNVKSLSSVVDEDLMLNLSLEPEVQTESARRSCDGLNNSLRETQDAATSLQDLKLLMENKETSTSNETLQKHKGQQYKYEKAEQCDKYVTTTETSRKEFDEGVETQEKSSWVCSCFLTPTLKRSIVQAFKVPYGEGDPIISLLELKDDTVTDTNQQKVVENVKLLEKKALNDQGRNENVTPVLDTQDYSDSDENPMLTLDLSLAVGLDVPKRFSCLYDFPAITRITTIAGNCESSMALWEKNDIFLTEPTKSVSGPSKKQSKDVSWEESLMPEKKLPNPTEDVDQKAFTVLFRSRSMAVHSENRSTSSTCRCRSERGFSEMSESQDEEDEVQSGCFSCFRHLFGRRKKRFFDYFG